MKLYIAIILICFLVAAVLHFLVDKGSDLIEEANKITATDLSPETVKKLKETYGDKIDADTLEKAKKALKGKMQFMFATHNANIPVLGDSEKIISCRYSESKIEVHGGTIDNNKTQKQVVDIMEGGEEAFNRRKSIYELWSYKK